MWEMWRPPTHTARRPAGRSWWPPVSVPGPSSPAIWVGSVPDSRTRPQLRPSDLTCRCLSPGRLRQPCNKGVVLVCGSLCPGQSVWAPRVGGTAGEGSLRGAPAHSLGCPPRHPGTQGQALPGRWSVPSLGRGPACRPCRAPRQLPRGPRAGPTSSAWSGLFRASGRHVPRFCRSS